MRRKPLVETIEILVARATLSFLAFVCLFGVAVQVADEGGGRSGFPARSKVTWSDRATMGAGLLAAGVLCLAGVAALSRRSGDRPG